MSAPRIYRWVFHQLYHRKNTYLGRRHHGSSRDFQIAPVQLGRSGHLIISQSQVSAPIQSVASPNGCTMEAATRHCVNIKGGRFPPFASTKCLGCCMDHSARQKLYHRLVARSISTGSSVRQSSYDNGTSSSETNYHSEKDGKPRRHKMLNDRIFDLWMNEFRNSLAEFRSAQSKHASQPLDERSMCMILGAISQGGQQINQIQDLMIKHDYVDAWFTRVQQRYHTAVLAKHSQGGSNSSNSATDRTTDEPARILLNMLKPWCKIHMFPGSYFMVWWENHFLVHAMDELSYVPLEDVALVLRLCTWAPTWRNAEVFGDTSKYFPSSRILQYIYGALDAAPVKLPASQMSNFVADISSLTCAGISQQLFSSSSVINGIQNFLENEDYSFIAVADEEVHDRGNIGLLISSAIRRVSGISEHDTCGRLLGRLYSLWYFKFFRFHQCSNPGCTTKIGNSLASLTEAVPKLRSWIGLDLAIVQWLRDLDELAPSMDVNIKYWNLYNVGRCVKGSSSSYAMYDEQGSDTSNRRSASLFSWIPRFPWLDTPKVPPSPVINAFDSDDVMDEKLFGVKARKDKVEKDGIFLNQLKSIIYSHSDIMPSAYAFSSLLKHPYSYSSMGSGEWRFQDTLVRTTRTLWDTAKADIGNTEHSTRFRKRSPLLHNIHNHTMGLWGTCCVMRFLVTKSPDRLRGMKQLEESARLRQEYLVKVVDHLLKSYRQYIEETDAAAHRGQPRTNLGGLTQDIYASVALSTWSLSEVSRIERGLDLLDNYTASQWLQLVQIVVERDRDFAHQANKLDPERRQVRLQASIKSFLILLRGLIQFHDCKYEGVRQVVEFDSWEAIAAQSLFAVSPFFAYCQNTMEVETNLEEGSDSVEKASKPTRLAKLENELLARADLLQLTDLAWAWSRMQIPFERSQFDEWQTHYINQLQQAVKSAVDGSNSVIACASITRTLVGLANNPTTRSLISEDLLNAMISSILDLRPHFSSLQTVSLGQAVASLDLHPKQKELGPVFADMCMSSFASMNYQLLESCLLSLHHMDPNLLLENGWLDEWFRHSTRVVSQCWSAIRARYPNGDRSHHGLDDNNGDQGFATSDASANHFVIPLEDVSSLAVHFIRVFSLLKVASEYRDKFRIPLEFVELFVQFVGEHRFHIVLIKRACPVLLALMNDSSISSRYGSQLGVLLWTMSELRANSEEGQLASTKSDRIDMIGNVTYADQDLGDGGQSAPGNQSRKPLLVWKPRVRRGVGIGAKKRMDGMPVGVDDALTT